MLLTACEDIGGILIDEACTCPPGQIMTSGICKGMSYIFSQHVVTPDKVWALVQNAALVSVEVS